MPVKVLDQLPSVKYLSNENNLLITSSCFSIKQIRPLKILILNLMSKKIETENQFLRLLSNYPLQLDIKLLCLDNYKPRNTPIEHINSFYYKLDDIQNDNFDGLIITGAPLGLVHFNHISYWSQIKKILNWAKEHVTSILFICWAVQAALNILYGISKKIRDTKLSGIFEHRILSPYSLLTRGFDDNFFAPHSRFADFPTTLITNYTDLELLALSEEAGAYLMVSQDKRLVFVTGHPEYDALTLSNEYYRDYKAGLNPKIPFNYFPQDDPSLLPKITWRSHGNLLFLNWLNYYVYQTVPFNLLRINPLLNIY
ncbi:MAG: homoserine O-succinyltransferase [Pantoea sp. Brub]|nr:homoserine O-succinyltransferase [Pantoea sp. Brub]